MKQYDTTSEGGLRVNLVFEIGREVRHQLNLVNPTTARTFFLVKVLLTASSRPGPRVCPETSSGGMPFGAARRTCYLAQGGGCIPRSGHAP